MGETTGDPALHRISGQPERRAGMGWKMGGRGMNRRGRHHAALSNLALSHPLRVGGGVTSFLWSLIRQRHGSNRQPLDK